MAPKHVLHNRIVKLKRTSDVLAALLERREAQNRKWGDQSHHPLVWSAILGEEVGEVSKELVENGSRDVATMEDLGRDCLRRLRDELLDVAAVATAEIEQIDRILNK